MDPVPVLALEGQGYPRGRGHRCASCEEVILDEWLNWLKCWPEPYDGENGEKRILAYPPGDYPIAFLLDSQETIGNYSFWWFFLCKRCRDRFRNYNLRTENKEIVFERIYVPGKGASLPGGPNVARRFLQLPTFTLEDGSRNSIINGPLGISDHWSPASTPRSPSASSSSDPWSFGL
jgi:hypothetical protein